MQEPIDSIELGLCFEKEDKMEEWIQNIKTFRDGCQEEKQKLDDKEGDSKRAEKVLNDMAGLDQLTIMENQINSLVK